MDAKFGVLFKKDIKYQITVATYRDELDEYESNAKSLNAILKGLADSILLKSCNVRQPNMLGKN